jgi:hypothetical protein
MEATKMIGTHPTSKKKALHPESRQTSSQFHSSQAEEQKGSIVEAPNHKSTVVKGTLSSFANTRYFPSVGLRQGAQEQRIMTAPESKIRSLIPSDAVTQKLLVEVLAEMIRFEYGLGTGQVNKLENDH